ncbi:uncharacterized protein LOC124286220 [Haliotis rubra]|uniref:uncharacterized protein LOC124286220 n=1 Tax=Haliotis rubra TaxID=36100 RepID=UPI001EE51771|nr:uncharacterized protein LOC124286220 [Haliotis rubra]XP_046578516.1 uncharacterized protein LOC124286220 [Haliotis rubra]XP_046578517.1 uncharacterized protein LOC124286220 [Haliotis rubra]
MDKSDSVQRGMYIPMEAIQRDLVSRYGNVRVLVVPKERNSSTSSCKENEDCFSKADGNVFEDDSEWVISDSKSRSTPVSPDFSYRSRQVFEYRGQAETDRFTQERKDTEILKSKTESTPKRVPEVLQPPLRYEKVADENASLTPRQAADPDRQSGDSMSEKIKRQLFAGIENEYRVIRNDTYHRVPPEPHDDVYVDRHRDSDKHPMYYAYRDKRSPGPEHPRAFFDRDFTYHDRPLHSPSWATPTPPSPFPDHHRCDCMDRQQRHMESGRERLEMTKKRKFGDTSSENSVPLSPRTKKQKCTCSMMEMNFLQMAEAAYKNIRRQDTTPASFEQFSRELVQTNSVLKESVSILSTIREMCEHRNCIRN